MLGHNWLTLLALFPHLSFSPSGNTKSWNNREATNQQTHVIRGSSGHKLRGTVAVEAEDAFQLDVRLRLTNGIKELCCGAQNRTEESIPKRESEREKKKKMTQTWEASFWNNLQRPVLTQTHEYRSHIFCRIFFFFPFSQNASWGLQPWKMSSVPFLAWLDPYVTEVEKKNQGDFIYLTTCGHPGGVTEENKQT